MNRILAFGTLFFLSSGPLWAQGFSRPPGTPVATMPIPNTLVWLQPSRMPGFAGPLMWNRGPMIGTGPYANRPWLATPWAIMPGTNTTVVVQTPVYVPQPVAVQPRLQEAMLSIAFPFSEAQVRFNGQLDGQSSATRTYRSPGLQPGETYTFQVQARWTKDGQEYEWDKLYRLGAGESMRVTVFGGFPVAAVTPPSK